MELEPISHCLVCGINENCSSSGGMCAKLPMYEMPRKVDIFYMYQRHSNKTDS